MSWTHQAASSLREIHDYIARTRPLTAQRTVESLLDRTLSLASAPRNAPRYHAHPEVRILRYGHFRLAYTIREEDDTVIILMVFHGLVFLPFT
ncbi:MAG: type II toxin-antitoxin system RelE/ParE family toxin [Acidobacteriota bacterium]